MPRAKQTMDGNTAAAHVAYAYTDVAAIYPITPSSPMADSVDQWSAAGQKNIFGNQVKVVEMESEAGAAGAVHGSLGAGAVTTTFTASQGLLLMIPNMYKIAAEQLPCVFDVSARTVATQSLNIFGDHSDVMACRQTGFAMLVESSVQEVMDLSPVAHLCAIEGKVPFLNFFDGFRTSHEYQKIEKWDYADLKEMCNMEAVEEFRKKALNPEHPKMRGSHENGDVFFQHREACNSVYNALPAVVEKYMAKINAKLGTNYDLFNYYGAPDADRVIVAMGSICDVADEVIDYLNAKGEKVGIVKVRLYRPWVSASLLKVLPKTAKKVAVLDRTKEPGSLGEPLYLDVAATLREAGLNDVVLTGGRYGLGSKDTPPSSIFALFKELEKDQPKERFTLGITDDVTFLSLPEVKPAPITAAAGTKECKFWGLGGDGTVGANKNSVKIIGDHTDKYVQAYMALPDVRNTQIYRIDPELLLEKVLGLNVEYQHLSYDGSILGMTSFTEMGVQVFEDDDNEAFFFLDGKTVLVEKDLNFDSKLKSRKNFTLMHEGSHQIFKMLFPNDYGVTQKSAGVHYYKANSERNKPISDWEEWQANTLGAAILLPENLIKQGMYLFSLGEKIECLNKIYYPSVYKRFDALADFLGCSKKALAIRMKQLGLLKKEYLDNPFDLVTVYPEVSEL